MSESDINLLKVIGWKDGRVTNLRVEYTPVPIILLMLRKMMVTGPTVYPRGELRSTGAPLASW